MSNNRFTDRLADYVPVNARITAFYQAYPTGSLQSEIVELSDKRVVMKASAFRTPDDIRPAIGYATQTIPGTTPYTRSSEIENCETSSWGRALAALGFEVKRSIASRDEVESKSGETAPDDRVSLDALSDTERAIADHARRAAYGLAYDELTGFLKQRGFRSWSDFSARGKTHFSEFTELVSDFDLQSRVLGAEDELLAEVGD